MRIALMYSGEPRLFKQGWHQTRQALRTGRDVDVFLHAWHEPARVGETYRSAWLAQDFGPIEADTPTELLRLYRPKAHKIEPYRTFQTHGLGFDGDETHPCVQATLSHLYSNLQVSLLKQQYELEHQFQYDLCIHLRYDLVAWDRLELTELPGPNRVLFGVVCKDYEVGDQIYLADSETMDRFLTVFHHVRACYDDHVARFPKYAGKLVSHWVMRSFLDTRGIQAGLLPDSFGYGILRPGELHSSFNSPHPHHEYMAVPAPDPELTLTLAPDGPDGAVLFTATPGFSFYRFFRDETEVQAGGEPRYRHHDPATLDGQPHTLTVRATGAETEPEATCRFQQQVQTELL